VWRRPKCGWGAFRFAFDEKSGERRTASFDDGAILFGQPLTPSIMCFPIVKVSTPWVGDMGDPEHGTGRGSFGIHRSAFSIFGENANPQLHTAIQFLQKLFVFFITFFETPNDLGFFFEEASVAHGDQRNVSMK